MCVFGRQEKFSTPYPRMPVTASNCTRSVRSLALTSWCGSGMPEVFTTHSSCRAILSASWRLKAISSPSDEMLTLTTSCMSVRRVALRSGDHKNTSLYFVYTTITLGVDGTWLVGEGATVSVGGGRVGTGVDEINSEEV